MLDFTGLVELDLERFEDLRDAHNKELDRYFKFNIGYLEALAGKVQACQEDLRTLLYNSSNFRRLEEVENTVVSEIRDHINADENLTPENLIVRYKFEIQKLKTEKERLDLMFDSHLLPILELSIKTLEYFAHEDRQEFMSTLSNRCIDFIKEYARFIHYEWYSAVIEDHQIESAMSNKFGYQGFIPRSLAILAAIRAPKEESERNQVRGVFQQALVDKLKREIRELKEISRIFPAHQNVLSTVYRVVEGLEGATPSIPSLLKYRLEQIESFEKAERALYAQGLVIYGLKRCKAARARADNEKLESLVYGARAYEQSKPRKFRIYEDKIKLEVGKTPFVYVSNAEGERFYRWKFKAWWKKSIVRKKLRQYDFILRGAVELINRYKPVQDNGASDRSLFDYRFDRAIQILFDNLKIRCAERASEDPNLARDTAYLVSDIKIVDSSEIRRELRQELISSQTITRAMPQSDYLEIAQAFVQRKFNEMMQQVRIYKNGRIKKFAGKAICADFRPGIEDAPVQQGVTDGGALLPFPAPATVVTVNPPYVVQDFDYPLSSDETSRLSDSDSSSSSSSPGPGGGGGGGGGPGLAIDSSDYPLPNVPIPRTATTSGDTMPGETMTTRSEHRRAVRGGNTAPSMGPDRPAAEGRLVDAFEEFGGNSRLLFEGRVLMSHLSLSGLDSDYASARAENASEERINISQGANAYFLKFLLAYQKLEIEEPYKIIINQIFNHLENVQGQAQERDNDNDRDGKTEAATTTQAQQDEVNTSTRQSDRNKQGQREAEKVEAEIKAREELLRREKILRLEQAEIERQRKKRQENNAQLKRQHFPSSQASSTRSSRGKRKKDESKVTYAYQ